MKRLTILFFAVFFFLIIVPLHAAEVKNAVSRQMGNRVQFTYDLIGDEAEADVDVIIKVGDKEYKAADLHLEGDFGKVKRGQKKTIFWNVLQDFPRGLDANIVCDVTAGGGKSFSEKATGLKFVLIPAGSFQMGGDESAETVAGNSTYSGAAMKAEWFKDEHPRHRVTISHPFYMATTETTVAAFRSFVKETGYVTDAEKQGKGYVLESNAQWKERKGATWRKPGFTQADRHPVVMVSWNDAQAFIRWLNGRTKGPQYRLPTEAQWEYACRAGTETPFYWGYKPSGVHANFADAAFARTYSNAAWAQRDYKDGYVHTSPVGNFRPNAWGLYDMSGNAWEWTQDWYGDYSPGGETDPDGPGSGDVRVLRGGAWSNHAANMRCARRNGNTPDNRSSNIGFRLVRDYR